MSVPQDVKPENDPAEVAEAQQSSADPQPGDGSTSPAVDVSFPAADRRPAVAGAAAGLWALIVGVALVASVVMLTWALSPSSAGDSAAAWRAAGTTWLGAHLVPLRIGGQALSLLPLGALLLGLLLTRRAGRWAGRLLPAPTLPEVLAIVGSCALVYGVGGAGVAWISGTPSTGANPGVTLLVTSAVAAAGATWGIGREAGLVGLVRSRLSDAAWRTTVGGLAAVVGLFGAGSFLVLLSLLRSSWHVWESLAGLDAGPAGALLLTLVAMLSLPTLSIWGMSVTVGPGFALGSEGALSVLGGDVQTLPALPVLAAVPATVPGWAPALLLVPVAMGALAGRIRWGADLPTTRGIVWSGAGLAAVVFVLTAGLTALASGSLGGGRLAHVGPAVLPVAGAAAVMVVLGFAAEAGYQAGRLNWSLHRAAARSSAARWSRPEPEVRVTPSARAGTAAQAGDDKNPNDKTDDDTVVLTDATDRPADED